MNLCHYCKTREGIHQFQNGRWCCAPTYQQCPVVSKRMHDAFNERSEYSNIRIMKKAAATGLFPCKYCGEPGLYYGGYINKKHKFYCTPKGRDCPEFNNYLSKVHKEKFENNPDLLVKMSKKMKEVQNRPEVKEQKSNSMIQLHRGDCEPCKEFQENFTEAQKARRTEKYNYYSKYRKEN